MSPLHDPTYNVRLRLSIHPTDQLLLLLLRRVGLALTVTWLDLLAEHGPTTPVPGLTTLYDTNRFAREALELTEEVLARSRAPAGLNPELSMLPIPGWSARMSKNTRKRRRCRVAVHLAVCAAQARHVDLFERARQWEITRHYLPPANGPAS